MTFGDWAFALVVFVVFVCAVVCGIAWKVAYGDGWEDGRRHERNRRNERKIAMNRSSLLGPDFDHDDADEEVERWLASLREDEDERLADTGELRVLGPARTLQDVSGQLRTEQPAPRDTSTGAFRAALVERTDAFIAQLAQGEQDLAS